MELLIVWGTYENMDDGENRVLGKEKMLLLEI